MQPLDGNLVSLKHLLIIVYIMGVGSLLQSYQRFPHLHFWVKKKKPKICNDIYHGVSPLCTELWLDNVSFFKKSFLCCDISSLQRKKKPDEKKNQNEKFIEKTKTAEKNDNYWNCILMS